MPLPPFQVDIQKVFAGEYWTNRYYVNVPSLAAGMQVADEIVACERAVTSILVTFDRVRCSDTTPGTDVYATNTLQLAGQLDVGQSILPLWNIVRVDFNTGSGRPSRKYLRGIAAEDIVSNMQIDLAVFTTIGTSYANAMLAITEYVDIDGEVFTSATVIRALGMRQLRRGSKRRVQPVI